MPLGTTLLRNPGWNEGEARYEALGYAGVSPCRALCGNEHDVLTMISTRKHFSEYAHLFQ